MCSQTDWRKGNWSAFLIVVSATKMSSPQTTPTTGPQIRSTTTEQTGVHYSSIYLHTVPGTLKIVCMVMKWLGFIWFDISDSNKYNVCFPFSRNRFVHWLASYWFRLVVSKKLDRVSSSVQSQWSRSGLAASC